MCSRCVIVRLQTASRQQHSQAAARSRHRSRFMTACHRVTLLWIANGKHRERVMAHVERSHLIRLLSAPRLLEKTRVGETDGRSVSKSAFDWRHDCRAAFDARTDTDNTAAGISIP